MSTRTPQEVFEDHLRLRLEGDVETDLARNYADDVVLLTADGASIGQDMVKTSTARLHEQLPNAHFEFSTRLVCETYAFLEWRATSDRYRVDDGADSFVIEQGRIRMQSIHYTLIGEPDR